MDGDNMNSLPWKLRLFHHGFAHISLSWAGRDIHFCPIAAIQENDIAIVLWNWPEHLKGCIQTLKQGNTLHVVAPQAILDYLSQFGNVVGSTSYSQDGLEIKLESFCPIPPWSGSGGVERIRAGIKRPDRALRRLKQKLSNPECEPHLAEITFPSGARFVHLNTALHKFTDAQWLGELTKKMGNPDWTLSGVDVGHSDSWMDNIVHFTQGNILLCDILGDFRTKNGLKHPLLTPIVDLALSKDMDCFVFATQASFRFDTVDLIVSDDIE
jgi:hypothetical protein